MSEPKGWQFPVACFIRDQVYAASAMFNDLAKSEANRKRFDYVVGMVKPIVAAELTKHLSTWTAFIVTKAVGIGPIVEIVAKLLVESVYQAAKANLDPPKTAPVEEVSTTVDTHEQAEPGNA